MHTAIDKNALKAKQRAEFIRTLGMRPDDARLIEARKTYAAKYGLSQGEITRAALKSEQMTENVFEQRLS